jgi:hypothetical protein
MVTRIVPAMVLLLVLADVRPAACEGWSLPNPLSSATKTESKAQSHASKTAKKEPSALDKLGAGTTSFFRKTGETLGLKKPESKKVVYASPQSRRIQPPAKQESSSWLSWMKPKEPEKEKDVRGWLKNSKRVNP